MLICFNIPIPSLSKRFETLHRHSIVSRNVSSSSRYQIRATVSFREKAWNTRAPYFFASGRCQNGLRDRERRWIEMREMLEWSTVGSGRGGWNGMDIPPWNGFIVPDAGFIPAMVVQIHQQLDLLGRWINLSIHGRRSTDGASTGG